MSAPADKVSSRGGKGSALISNPGKADKSATTFSSERELLIIHIDVDQGESTLLLERTTEGETIWCAVIDGGFSVAGRGAFMRYLRRFGVGVVNLLVCSHFDGDHTKGLTSFLAEHATKNAHEINPDDGVFLVETLLVRNASTSDFKSQTKLALLKAAKNKVKVQQAEEGLVPMPKRSRCELECLRAVSDPQDDENAGSLAFRLRFGAFSYYTAGDLPSALETELEVGKVDAFKCGHHGSANSTPPALLQEMQPRAAFISCGRNSYGHPTYDVVERLAAVGSPVQAFYMTNCIHNRRCVNRDFVKIEREDCLPQYQKLCVGFDAGVLGADPLVYNKAALTVHVDAEEPDEEAERDVWLARRRIYRAMHRAARHIEEPLQQHEGKDRILGHAGGSPLHFGSVVLRTLYRDSASESAAATTIGTTVVKSRKPKAKATSSAAAPAPSTPQPAVFQVGLFEEIDSQTDFRWYEHRADKVEPIASADVRIDKAMDLIRKEEVKEAQRKKSAKTPVKKGAARLSFVASSPMKMQDRVEEREAQYARFTIPTVVGLTTRAGGELYIPFCAVCRLDFDDGSTDWELITIDEAAVHRLCCRELFVRKLAIKDEDEDPLTGENVYDSALREIEGFDDALHTMWPKLAWAEFKRARGQAPAPATAEAVSAIIANMNGAILLPESTDDSDDDSYSSN